MRNAFDKARANNKETGPPRMDVPYESEFMRIVAMDDSIVPEVMRGAGEVVYPKKNLKDITTETKHSIWMGDINIDHKKILEPNYQARHLADLLLEAT